MIRRKLTGGVGMWVYIVFAVDGCSERVDGVFTSGSKAKDYLESKRSQ